MTKELKFIIFTMEPAPERATKTFCQLTSKEGAEERANNNKRTDDNQKSWNNYFDFRKLQQDLKHD